MSGLWGDKDEKTSTGTVTITANGLCTGVATLIDTEAAVGDYIVTDAETVRIISITSNTVCHVAPQTLGGVVAGCSANQIGYQEGPIYVSATEVGANASHIFGVDTTEIGVSGGTILTATLLTNGSGYHANAVVTVSGGGGASGAANAEANSTGYIATINITNAGTSYETAPTFTVAAPAAQSFNASSAVAANGFIGITANKFQVNEIATYAVTGTNTAIVELTSGTDYYVQASNSTGVYLAATYGGAAITLTAGSSETGHSLQGETATVATTVGGVQGAAHAGWVRRTVGTGNKAGRVSYETLVASRLSGDAADDSEVPDS
jgi:hypothetical protein